jgi:ankyrin repeat protein
MISRPAINLDYQCPKAYKLHEFIDYLQINFKDEPNLEIACKVLKTLVYIKLNFPFIAYAINHKNSDASIYKFPEDKDKGVLRAPFTDNDMAFHIFNYDNAEEAIEAYQRLIDSIENGIEVLQSNPSYAKTFINKIRDNETTGCMEFRLSDALLYLSDPQINNLESMFHNLQTDINKNNIDDNDIGIFSRLLLEHFASHIDTVVLHQGNEVNLSWNLIHDYLKNILLYPHSLIANGIFEHCIVYFKPCSEFYYLDFAEKRTARHYLNLIRLNLSNKDYKNIKDDVLGTIQTIAGESAMIVKSIKLTNNQFKMLLAQCGKTFADINIVYNYDELVSSLLHTLTIKDEEQLRAIISLYPAIINFPLPTQQWQTENMLPIFYAIAHNDLAWLKMLINEFNANINKSLNTKSAGSKYNKITPLIFACGLASHSNEAIIHYLLEQGADINAVAKSGVTALIVASQNNKANAVKLLLRYKNSKEKPAININHQDNKGKSALFYAAEYGYIDIASLLMNHPDCNILTNYLSKKYTIGENAKRNGYESCATLINHHLEAEIERIKLNHSALIARHPFDRFSGNLLALSHDNYNDNIYIKYMIDIKQLAETGNNSAMVLASEKQRISLRLAWSKIISETQKLNQSYAKAHDIQLQVLARIYELGISDPSYEYSQCIDTLMHHTAITITFNADFLQNNILQHLKALNYWENPTRNQNYQTTRDLVEQKLFNFLPADIKHKFLTELALRPRYGALHIIDNHIKPTAKYGQSFIVLKDIAKFNALFAPGNPINHFADTSQFYKLCTIHGLSYLLWQCPTATLLALIHYNQNGYLPKDFNQNGTWSELNGGHLEALMAEFNVFDANIVETIHISPDEYLLTQDEINTINNLGIHISNSKQNPYIELTKQFEQALTRQNNQEIKQLITQFPSLAKTRNAKIKKTCLYAIAENNTEMLKLLITHRPFINSQPLIEMLFAATADGRLDIFFEILSVLEQHYRQPLAEIIDKKQNGMTLLHQACYHGNVKLTHILLKSDANMLEKNNQMLRADEMMNHSKRNYINPLQIVKKTLVNSITIGNYYQFIEIMDSNQSWPAINLDKEANTALFLIAKHGQCSDHIKMLAYLIKQGVALDTSNYQGRTPLMIAVYHNHLDLVTYLIQSKQHLNVNHVSSNTKMTALHLAIANNNSAMVTAILTIDDINLDMIDAKGLCPLVFALTKREPMIAKIILEAYLQKPCTIVTKAHLEAALKIAHNMRYEDVIKKITAVKAHIFVKSMGQQLGLFSTRTPATEASKVSDHSHALLATINDGEIPPRAKKTRLG